MKQEWTGAHALTQAGLSPKHGESPGWKAREQGAEQCSWMNELRAGMSVRHSNHFLSSYTIRKATFWTQCWWFHWQSARQTMSVDLIHHYSKNKANLFSKRLASAGFSSVQKYAAAASCWPLPTPYWQSTSQTNGVGAKWEPFLVAAEWCTWLGGGWHLCPSLSNVRFHFPSWTIRVS